MKSIFQTIVRTTTLLTLIVLTGCATNSPVNQQSMTVLPGWEKDKADQKVVPVFTILQSEEKYNRIGIVEAIDDGDDVEVRVNPDKPAVYYKTSTFTTAKGEYTNEVYRIHFEKTPFTYLTAGKFPGIFVIFTSDRDNHLILVTTVMTCGCYVAIMPTQWLSKESYPVNWPEDTISIYGEILPAFLGTVNPGQYLDFTIRPGGHRVMAIQVLKQPELAVREYETAMIYDYDHLHHLKTRTGKETSFFYQNWPLTGHVKGAFKWWEMLLLSIPSLDLFVGMDKDIGNTEEIGNPFYTSLQPWFRSASDMNDFSSFLQFHGWNL